MANAKKNDCKHFFPNVSSALISMNPFTTQKRLLDFKPNSF